MTGRPFVYLDTETTGLDFMVHDVVEIAWAVNDADIQSYVPVHSLANADPKALEINGYWKRELHTKEQTHRSWGDYLLRDLRDATLVGSNPSFDAAFLRRKLGVAVWHYRLLDISAYAAGVLKLDDLPGMATVAELLRQKGYDIGSPDHTTEGDVRVLRDCHNALRDLVA